MYAYNSSSSLYLSMKKILKNTSLVELFTALWVSTGLMIRIQDTGSPSSVCYYLVLGKITCCLLPRWWLSAP